MAGVALGDIDFHFAWQVWHLVTWTCALRGRRGTYGTYSTGLCVLDLAFLVLDWLWYRAWFPINAVVAAALCVTGVALGNIDFHLRWQV